jgi:hypothetical protein
MNKNGEQKKVFHKIIRGTKCAEVFEDTWYDQHFVRVSEFGSVDWKLSRYCGTIDEAKSYIDTL